MLKHEHIFSIPLYFRALVISYWFLVYHIWKEGPFPLIQYIILFLYSVQVQFSYCVIYTQG